MKTLSSRLRRDIAASLMLLAAGCGVLEGGAGEAEICPVPSILETLQELVRFKPGAGYDLSQALFHVKLNTFEGECDIGKKEITLTVAIDMTALRGAAMQKSRAEFAFWVWIMDRDKKLLTRHRFPIITKFEGRDSRIDFTDFFDVIIPQRADHAPPDWRIFIGLELTKEELAYNRRRLGSKGRR